MAIEQTNENSDLKREEKLSNMDTDAQNKHKEQCNLFYPNIPLFIEKREIILDNPRLYGIKAPKTFYDSMYASTGGEQVTLGELLNIWENEKVFTVKCTKCDGSAVIYRFGGSPLSGSLFEKKTICTKCSHIDTNNKYGSFGELRRARGKYLPIEPIDPNPASIQELIAICKGEDYITNESESEEISVVKGAETFIKFGNKEFPTQQFWGMMTGQIAPPKSDRKFIIGEDGKIHEVEKKDAIIVKQPIKNYGILKKTAWRFLYDTVPEEESISFGEEEILTFDDDGRPNAFWLTDGEMTSNMGSYQFTDEGLKLFGEKVEMEFLPDGHLKVVEVESEEMFEYVYERVPYENYEEFL